MASPLQVLTNRLRSLSRSTGTRNEVETRSMKTTRTVPIDVVLEIAQRITSLGALLDFSLLVSKRVIQYYMHQIADYHH